MDTYILKDGQTSGPYTADQVDEGLRTGRFTIHDHFWIEGLAGWVPLAQIPGLSEAPASAPKLPPAPPPPNQLLSLAPPRPGAKLLRVLQQPFVEALDAFPYFLVIYILVAGFFGLCFYYLNGRNGARDVQGALDAVKYIGWYFGGFWVAWSMIATLVQYVIWGFSRPAAEEPLAQRLARATYQASRSLPPGTSQRPDVLPPPPPSSHLSDRKALWFCLGMIAISVAAWWLTGGQGTLGLIALALGFIGMLTAAIFGLKLMVSTVWRLIRGK